MKLRIALAPCSAMLVLLILSGCAGNPFKKFYQHMPDANALLERRVNPASASIDMYQHTERKDASVRFGGVQYRRHDGSRRHGSSARQGGAMRCAMTDREYTDFSDGCLGRSRSRPELGAVRAARTGAHLAGYRSASSPPLIRLGLSIPTGRFT